jgi:hypothetical protein
VATLRPWGVVEDRDVADLWQSRSSNRQTPIGNASLTPFWRLPARPLSTGAVVRASHRGDPDQHLSAQLELEAEGYPGVVSP